MHYVLSTLYCLMWCQMIIFYRPWHPTTQHLGCGDYSNWRYSPSYFCLSSLNLRGNQLQQLPAGVFSSLTSLRSLTCVVVCIESVCVHVCVWLQSVYDIQIKAKLQLQGRVNKNVCEQSCNTFGPLYMSTLYCLMWFQIIMLHHHSCTPTTQHPSCGDCAHWRFSPSFFCLSSLNLQGNQLQQLPPGVFSSLTSLRSLTCVVVCIETLCTHSCVWLPSIWCTV